MYLQHFAMICDEEGTSFLQPDLDQHATGRVANDELNLYKHLVYQVVLWASDRSWACQGTHSRVGVAAPVQLCTCVEYTEQLHPTARPNPENELAPTPAKQLEAQQCRLDAYACMVLTAVHGS
jgi:hypothetical protein